MKKAALLGCVLALLCTSAPAREPQRLPMTPGAIPGSERAQRLLLPDYIVVGVVFSQYYVHRIYFGVKNIGDATAPGYFPSVDVLVTVGCAPRTWRKIYAIDSPTRGRVETMDVDTPFPNNTSKVEIIIDPNNRVREKSKTNNTWVKDNCIH